MALMDLQTKHVYEYLYCMYHTRLGSQRPTFGKNASYEELLRIESIED